MKTITKQIIIAAVLLPTANCLLPTASSAQTISTYAGTGVAGYSGDGGAATSAQLYSPCGVAVDASGNIYISEYGNNRIRKVNTSGVISTFAGTGNGGYSGDGGAATSAELNGPFGVAVDALGNVYIGDNSNHCIRKINTSGVISTFAGIGTGGYSGDGGTATSAMLSFPGGAAFDALGNFYIADYGNNRIRMVNTSGVISTFAGTGTGGYSGDGGAATSAMLYFSRGVSVDAASGNVYIADFLNHRIRMVNTSGVISTIAGNGTIGWSGDGGPAISATLNYPTGVVVDASGNMYIADRNNHLIRKVNTSGVISTFAGNGASGFSGDGGVATSAQLYNPTVVAVDASCDVHIADGNNNRIRKVDVGSCIPQPVELLYFTAAAENNSLVRCEWATASELNNDYFAIERSKDGITFSQIGIRQGAGNSSSTLYYTYYDNEPYTGLSYYRLKQVDFNGQYEYSPVRAVYIGTFNLINIYPNPSTEYIEYLLGSEEGGEVTVRLYDVLGREVYNKEETIEKGLSKERINTNNLSNGNYLLRITNGNKEKIQKQFVIK